MFKYNCYTTGERFSKLCTMCKNRKGKRKHILSKFSNETSPKSKSIAFNGKQLIYPVKESFEVCDYNPKYFMLLGWMIDKISMDLFMNAAHIWKISLTITCFPKSKSSTLCCTNGQLKTICGKKPSTIVYNQYFNTTTLTR